MITTVDIKSQQLANGFFQVGSGNEKMLIMGSCRVCPLVNYFDIWNRTIGKNRFTIYSIDPFNWNYHPVTNDFVNIQEVIKGLETDQRILDMLASVNVFIHEWYKNYGMFNIFRNESGNIYQFGMKATTDIMIPNWNDIFVLFSDFYKLDSNLQIKMKSDYMTYGKLSEETQKYVKYLAENNIRKFYDVALKSDLPEMGDYVLSNMHQTRFFWNFNHVAKPFTLKIFELMNDKFLHLPTTEKFLQEIAATDMFKDVFTHLTEYDINNFHFAWEEEDIKNFKEYNKI